MGLLVVGPCGGTLKAAAATMRFRRFIGFSLYTKTGCNAVMIYGGGVLRKRKFVWIAAACGAIGGLAASAPMAMVILNAASAPPGRLPEGWQLKVNRGTPEITLIGEPTGQVLRFRSRNSSFALE